ncbi:MAG: hypothetical protein HQL76_07955 [Magnetococcales bacterium]|nr:hypothetical protein [Magnetococcales bacterium]
MGSLSIVANQREYKIRDLDEGQTLVTGIASFRNALTLYERLTALQDSAARTQGHSRDRVRRDR